MGEAAHCPADQYTVGDVFVAELAVAWSVCANRDVIFELDAGEMFECDLDAAAYQALVEKIRSW